MGPLQNSVLFERVRVLLEDTQQCGTFVAGGGVLERTGYFVQPTIVRNLPDTARLVREEQFGPVLPVLRFLDLEDVIARVNATEFGLAASVWSADHARAFAVAVRIEAGTVWVNKHLDLDMNPPFGGAKQSGIGVELGAEALDEFTQATIINIAK